MTLTFTDALAYAESRHVTLPAEYYGTEQSGARSRAFSIAGVASRDQLQGVLDTLVKAHRDGLTFAQWKDLVKGGDIALDLPEHRLDNIFRTNMQCAYAQGHWKQQQANKDRRPYLMYDAINDTRTRPSHLALDNIILPVDDPFWDEHYPPNGYRCRCSVISLTAAQAEARGGETDEPEGGWPAPDKGWDYNPGAEPDQGIQQAAQPTPGGSDQVQQAMEAHAEPTSADAAEVASAKGTSVEALNQRVLSAREGALLESDINELTAIGALTDEQQGYLLQLVDEQRKTWSVELGVPKDLNIRTASADAALRMADSLPTVREASPRIAYRLPSHAAFKLGEEAVLNRFVMASEEAVTGRQFVIEHGANAVPLAAVTGGREWLLTPGITLRVIRIENETYFLEIIDG